MSNSQKSEKCMKRLAFAYLVLFVGVNPINAVAYEVDTAKYFAYTQEWGGVSLFLSKQPCSIASQEVPAYGTEALETCSKLGGTSCKLSPKVGWKHGQRFWPRERVVRDFCWHEVVGKTAENEPAETVAICYRWGGPESNISCTLPLKKSFVSTQSLPQAPMRPAF